MGTGDNTKDIITNENEQNNIWRLPFQQITWSFILTRITINFYQLQYILPTLGFMLMLLAMRNLRKVNRKFNLLWFIVLGRTILYVIHTTMIASPLNEVLTKHVFSVGSLYLLYEVFFCFFLRAAIKDVFKEHNVLMGRDPLSGIAVLYILLAMACIFTGMDPGIGLFIALIFGVIFLMLMSSFSKYAIELNKVAPDAVVEYNRRNDVVLRILFITVLCGVVGITCVIVNHRVIDFTATTDNVDTQIREELLQLQFPKEILDDIPEKDVNLLKGAVNVGAGDDLILFDNKTSMNATTVYIEMPNHELYMVVYFKWLQDKAIWNDGFSIWGVDDGYELIDGKLLCESRKQLMAAPIGPMNCGSVTTSSMFFGEQTSRQISGEVCFPFFSKNQRGYVFYKVNIPKDQFSGCNGMNYYHCNQPIQLPFLYANQRVLNGESGFKQHYMNFEMTESLKKE